MQPRNSLEMNKSIPVWRLGAARPTQHCEHRESFAKNIEAVLPASRSLSPFNHDSSRRAHEKDGVLPPVGIEDSRPCQGGNGKPAYWASLNVSPDESAEQGGNSPPLPTEFASTGVWEGTEIGFSIRGKDLVDFLEAEALSGTQAPLTAQLAEGMACQAWAHDNFLEKITSEPVFRSRSASADGPSYDKKLTPEGLRTVIKIKYESELPMLLEYREKGHNETALILDTKLLSALLTDIRSNLPEDSADNRPADLIRRVELIIEDFARAAPRTAEEKSEMFNRIQALKWLLSALQSTVQARGALTFSTRESASTANEPLNRKGREKARETINQYLATAATYISGSHAHSSRFSDVTLEIRKLCSEFSAQIVGKPKYTNECYSRSSLIGRLNTLSDLLKDIRSDFPGGFADSQADAAMHCLEDIIESLKQVHPESHDGRSDLFHRVHMLTWLLNALQSTAKAMAAQTSGAPDAITPEEDGPLSREDRRKISAAIDKALARAATHGSKLRAESPGLTEAIQMVRNICVDFSKKIKPKKAQIVLIKVKKHARRIHKNTNRNLQGVRRSLATGGALISSASVLGINNAIWKMQPLVYLDVAEGEHLRIDTESLLEAISWYQMGQLNLIALVLDVKDKVWVTHGDKKDLNVLAQHTRDALRKVEQRESQFKETSETAIGRLKNASKQIYELMRDFWEYEQRIKGVLDGADSYESEHIVNETEEFTHGIAALVRRIDSVVVRSTGRSLDIFSKDSRIARHVGEIFSDTKRELEQTYPGMDSSQYDKELEDFVKEHVARDFAKATSPEGKTMVSRVLRAYREAQDGTLLKPLSADDILAQIPNFSDYMAKSGVKSLSGRITFALLSGNPGFLIALATGVGGIPVPGLLKVLASPITFTLRYRQLSRSSNVGQPRPEAHFRELARRQSAIEAARVTKAFLPRGIKVGLAAGLTGYAVQQLGVSKVAEMARAQLPSDMVWSGGCAGVMFAATSTSPRRVEENSCRSSFDEPNDKENSRTKRDLPTQDQRSAAQREAQAAVTTLSMDNMGPLPPAEVKELEENFDKVYSSAYPPVGFEMEQMIRTELADILKNNGGGDLTPDSMVEYEIEEHSAATGETAGEAAGAYKNRPPKKSISLYNLARGELYYRGWNGHIRVKNLPAPLADLFRMNKYYGSSTFEITKMIEERISGKLDSYRDGPSKSIRRLLWEGKIRRRLWDLKHLGGRPHGIYSMELALAWGAALHTVSLQGMDKPFQNIFAVEVNSNEILLVDVEKGKTVTVPKNAQFFTQDLKKELREFFLSNMSLSDRLKYSEDPEWDGFSPVKTTLYTMPLKQTPLLWQRIQLSEPMDPDRLSRVLNDREFENAKLDADFLLTNAADVRLNALIQAGQMSMGALSYVMLVAPPGKAMLVANIITSIIGPLLSEAARVNEKEPAAREEARRERNKAIIASMVGLSPEAMTRAWTKFHNPRKLL